MRDTTIAVPAGLSELNRANLNNLPDLLRLVKGPDVPIGTLLNKIIATANAGNAAAVAAAQTATVAGTVAADDELTVTLTPPGYDAFSVMHKIVDGTSATTAGTELKNALNANSTFARWFVATNVAGVVTITAKYKGPAMNATKLAVAKTGAGSTTITAGAATFASGAGTDDTHLLID